MANPVVTVVGLKAFQRDLARMSDPSSGTLLRDMRLAAADALTPVLYNVRQAYPYQTGRLRGSVRRTRQRTGAGIRVGSKQVPYAGPVDFGGYPGDRLYHPEGRYLFPVAESLAPTVRRVYERDLTAAVGRYPWTNQTTNPGAVHD